ncbi:MAG: hypothetical protein HY929_07300, partial [Euryarchaeota archaeon]|nr:hypothetical protein [Euryarchaeota archaeon]
RVLKVKPYRLTFTVILICFLGAGVWIWYLSYIQLSISLLFTGNILVFASITLIGLLYARGWFYKR